MASGSKSTENKPVDPRSEPMNLLGAGFAVALAGVFIGGLLALGIRHIGGIVLGGCVAGLGMIIAMALWKSAATFKCTHCGGQLSTATRWTCGYCQNEHEVPAVPWANSILSACRRCGSAPHKYRCIYCKRLVELMPGGDDQTAAYSVSQSDVPATAEDIVARQQNELQRLQLEKQRVEYETQVMQARITLATAESRLAEVSGKAQNPFGQAILNMLDPLKSASERREALLLYERSTRQSILNRTDLSDEEKGKLIEELAMDVEQARLSDS